MSTRTLILHEEEIIALLEIIDLYKDKVLCYPNSDKLLDEAIRLEDTIIFQSNRELEERERRCK